MTDDIAGFNWETVTYRYGNTYNTLPQLSADQRRNIYSLHQKWQCNIKKEESFKDELLPSFCQH